MIRVFGTVGVDDADGPVSIGGPRQRRLLALLAIRVDTVIDIDWLAEHLWHDADRPDATDRAIRTYVSRLRQSLPDVAQSWLETAPSGYRLAAPAEAVEHRRFTALRAAATQARHVEDPLGALTMLDEALDLWRGDPFRELEDLDWARAEIEQLHLDRLEMLEERWEAALALGRHTQITGELAAFTAEHGHRDRAAQQYALALHRSGRTAEGLRVLSEFRRRLADEAGLDPSRGMIELEQAMLDDDPSLRVERLGRPLRGYRLLEEAGAGAFSVVWRGEQPSVQREVAIKQIRAELASQPEFIRRFEAEAHLVARLEHPHIVPLIDYWRDPDSAYLVMRWLPGGTLERRLDDGALSLDDTLAIARQVGGALSTAHARGIVHRDVKTANILFDDENHAFLGDFGIALEAAASDGPEAALSPGSPLYASPEQLRREPLGPQADVFSLGVVLYECLTGAPPFSVDGSPDDVLERRLASSVPDLADHRDDIPRTVSDALAKATASDPSDRFASVAAFVRELADGHGSTASEPLRTARVEMANPYVGLRAFDDGDTDRFFGRTRLVGDIVGRLDGHGLASRCTIVVGPSGSGKSSVVRAGVIPALRNDAVDGSSDWFVTTMLPRTDPYESLEAALLRIAVNPPPSLLAQLRDGPRGLLRSMRRCLGSDDDRLLLFIDQFEEVFVGGADADDFLDALAVAVEDPSSPLRLVATLRADYYDRPLGHRTFAPLLAAGAVDVVPLAADELERAIVEPAARLGVDFEAGLVARIAAEAVSLPSPLPLLQYTLSELFERRDPSSTTLTNPAYDELGGLSGALAARSEALYESADDEKRAAIRRVFGLLTDPTADSADLRRRLPLADLGDDEPARWVVDRFTEARLVTLDRDAATREPTIEVAHEALFREWPRLVRWLEDDRELLRTSAAIGRAASDWDASGRSDSDLYRGERLAAAAELDDDARRHLRPLDDEFIEASRHASEERGRAERTRVRRLRRLVAGIAAALVVALVAGAVAWRQQSRANEQAEAAELATLISRSASLHDDDRNLSLLLALEAHRREPNSATEFAVLDTLSRGGGASVTPSVTLDASGIEGDRVPIISPDGLRAFQVVDDRLVLYDFEDGNATDVGPMPLPSPESSGQWVADVDLDRSVVTSDVRNVTIGTVDGTERVPIQVDRSLVLVSPEIVGDRTVFVDVGATVPSMVVIDVLTGELVAEVDAVGFPSSATFGANGTLVAITRALDDGAGELVLLDAASGSEVYRVAIDAPARNMAFDDVAGQMLIPTENGELITIDVDSGEVVATVPTSGTSEVRAVGTRPDGLVVVATEGQIELLDRYAGPTGDVIPVRDAHRMRVRPDGSVLKVGNDGRTEIIEIGDDSPLIQERWDVADNALFNLGDSGEGGVAASVSGPTGAIETLDLATGERRARSLVAPEGSRPPIVAAAPFPDGLRTFTGDGALVARWDDDDHLIDEIGTASSEGSVAVAGNHGERRGVSIIERGDGSVEVALIAYESGLSVLLHLDAPDLASASPAPDDGVYLIDRFGTFRSYDASGQVIDEFDTGVRDLYVIDFQETPGGIIAAAGPFGGVLIDPASREVAEFPTSGTPSSLDLVNDDELLLISGIDGTITLWDVARGEPGGVIWEGSGSTNQGGSYFDETTGLLWIAASGELVGLPLNPTQWIELACAEVGRDLTEEEWDRLVPGGGPVRSPCS